MSNNKKLHYSACLWLATAACFINTPLSYGHGAGEKAGELHLNEDAYLAGQARLRETEVPYLLDHWQQQFSAKLLSLSTGLLSELIYSASANIENRGTTGEWSALTNWPFTFASAANLPDGRIIAWGANTVRNFTGGNFTYAGIWNPQTNQITSANNTVHSMFCGMPAMLEDGRVFVAGGDTGSVSSVKRTSTFNAVTQSWTRVQDMNVGRWYNGIVALPNGKVFTAVGEPGSPYPEVWSQNSGWSYLNGASLQTGLLRYPTVTEPKNWLPHVHLAPNGQIFHSGHTPQMNYINLEGNGSVLPVSLTNNVNTGNTPSVLVDEGQILQAGGTNYDANNSATAKTALININSNIPSREQMADMVYPRIFHNQVILPNGEVMVIGGNTTGVKFSDAGSQMTPEIWNPDTKTWRSVAPHSIPRTYHSVALLMTDGRVWSGGGGICFCSADHQDSQVFSPPYLFNPDGSPAVRPEISSAPDVVSYGQNVNVTATPGVSKFTLIRMSSTTHAINSDMRFLNVPFVSTNDGDYTLTLHTNRNVMTPGYWMLFAINQQGVPSVSKIIKVSTSDVPILTNPANQSSLVGDNVTMNIQATDPGGKPLTFDAVGLPLGLTINGSNGQITGIPASAGSSRVVVSVSNSTSTVSASFVWTVVNNQSPPVASNLIGNSNFGTLFADSVAPDEFLRGFDIKTSGQVNSIQGILNSRSLPQRGGSGGTLSSVTWPEDEYLVRIFGLAGTWDAYVGRIGFVTNTGRVLGPYGVATNGTSFDYTVPAGREIVGFTGTAATFLNSIGVMHRVRQVINQPPVATTIINQVNQIGDVVQLAVSAYDPEGDVLTYSAKGLPPELTINSTNGIISGTPTATGSYDAILTIRDNKGGQTALNFTWTIAASALTIDPLVTSPKQVNTEVNLTANASGGNNIQYKWSFGDGTPETTYSSVAAVSHVYTVPGLYVVRVTVRDGRGGNNTATFIQAIHLPHTAQKPAASTNILVAANGSSPDDDQLWVVNQDNDTVSAFSLPSHNKLAEIPVGKGPRSIAQAPDGNIWVANKYGGTLSIINPNSLIVLQTVDLPYGSQPHGVAFSPDGTAVYVVLEAAGKLLKLNSATGAQLASVDVGPNPRHLSVTPDGSKVLVSRFISPQLPGESTATIQTTENQNKLGGEIIVVDTGNLAIIKTIVLQHSDLVDDSTRGSGIPNYLYAAVISPDGQTAWVSSKQDNIKRGTLRNGNNLNFQNSVRGICSEISLVSLTELYSERLDFDNSGHPSAAIYDKSGNYLFIALEATREIAIVDAYQSILLDRINVGRAPDGLALSADGNTLFVNNFMDRTVSVVDLTDVFTRGDWAPPVVAQLSAVAQEKLSPAVLNGKQLFYDAKDPRLARDGYLSCAVCHNDGGHDGRVWDLTGLGEGLRNTIDLRGRSGTGHGLLHWSANFDEIQDFEGQIRGLAGGTGLMSDTDFAATSNTLGAPKAGKSADLDALAAYVNSLSRFAPSPYRNNDGSLTLEAAAGKALFTSAGCAQCHGGEPFSDSSSQANHNVGTIKATSGQRLGGALTGLDTPTLRDVWNTAPYLHDGSAPTLEAAISAHTAVPAVTALSAADIAKVAAYVKQIGDSEPAPDTTLPTVAITAPVNGGTVSGLAVNIAADAADNDGVTGVQFKLDGVNLGVEDTTAPYAISWDSTGVTNGAHTLTAVARDQSGNIKESGTVSVNVNNAPPPDTTPPTISIIAPVDGSTVSGAAVNITADASDNDSVAGVQFRMDGANLGAEDTSSPYALTWDSTGVTNGAHSLTAVARDQSGNTSVSATVSITVSNNTLPDVVVTSLSYANGIFTTTIKNQSSVATPAGVWIGVGYSVNGRYRTYGNVRGPLAGGASVTVGTASPYVIPNGAHTISAWADDVNRFPESDETNNQLSQTIQVGGSDTIPPAVAIDSPATGSTVSGAAVPLSATATDNVAVAGVQFKLNGVNLGAEDTAAPYTITWDSSTTVNGNYNLTAVARDVDGNVTTSSTVVVTVNNVGPPLLADVIVTDLTYSNGIFTSTIKNQGTAATPSGTVIGVGYSVDGIYRTYGVATGSLAPGASVTIGTTGAAHNIVNGDHIIAAAVDDVNRFPELVETNNQLTKAITINAADTTPPSVAITGPADGVTLPRSTLAVTASASDNIGLSSVQFKLDGVNLGARDLAAPYAVNFNTTAVTEGVHTLTAVAQDLAGNTTTSAPVMITVNNSVVTTLPDVVITSLSYSNGAFTCTVQNQGTQATPSGIPIGVSYFVNGVYRTYGSSAGALAAGASVNIGTTGPAYVIPSGSFTLSALADDNNRFAERDETNNRVSQTVTVP